MNNSLRWSITLMFLCLPVNVLAVQAVSVSALGQPQPRQVYNLVLAGVPASTVADEDGDGIVVIDPPPGQDFQLQRLGGQGDPTGASLNGTIPNRGDLGPPELQDAFSITQGGQQALVSVYDRIASGGQYHFRVGDEVFSFFIDPVAPAGTGGVAGAQQLGVWDPHSFSINVYDAVSGEFTGGVTSPSGSSRFLIGEGFQPQLATLPGSETADLSVAVGNAGDHGWVGLQGDFQAAPVNTQWSPYNNVPDRSNFFANDGWNGFNQIPGGPPGQGPVLAQGGVATNGLEVLGHILAGQQVPGLPPPPGTTIGESILVEINGPTAVINTNFLNVRSGPSVNEAVAATAAGGSELGVLGRSADGSWYQVALQGGGQGWVNSNFVLLRGNSSLLPVIAGNTGSTLVPEQELGLVVDKLEDIPGLAASYGLQLNDPITQLPDGDFLLSGGMQMQSGGFLKHVYENRQYDDFVEDFRTQYAAPSYCHDMYPLRILKPLVNLLIPSAEAQTPTAATGGLGADATGASRPWDVDYAPGSDQLHVALTNGAVDTFDRYRDNNGAFGRFPRDPPLFGDIPWQSDQPTYDYNIGDTTGVDDGYGAGDIAAAQASLEAAGYTQNADGIYEHPDDGPLSLRVGTTGGNRLREIQEELIQAQMADAGITVISDPITEVAVGWNQRTIDPCTNGNGSLCLNDNRFQVDVNWRDFQGNTGTGSVAPLPGDNSGLLYFFDPDNWEMLVKTLDGCDFNNSFWVFAAATTDVEYTLTVTDTQTSTTKSYFNPLGSPADAITDTSAFATCP